MKLRDRAADVGDQQALSALRKRQNAAVNGDDDLADGACDRPQGRRFAVVRDLPAAPRSDVHGSGDAEQRHQNAPAIEALRVRLIEGLAGLRVVVLGTEPAAVPGSPE